MLFSPICRQRASFLLRRPFHVGSISHASHKLPEPSKLALGPPRVRNQVAYFLLISATAFTYAAYVTNHETEVWTQKLSSGLRLGNITNLELRRLQQVELVKRLRLQYMYIHEKVAQFPTLLRSWLPLAYLAFAQPYADASDSKRLCWKICLLNAGVWIAWQVPRLGPRMMHTYAHNPLSGLSQTMLTSIFSHKSFVHLLFNCLALEGFGSSAAAYLSSRQAKIGQPNQLESTPIYHFGAFFITAGVFSSLVSHIVTAKIRYPRVVAQLSSPTNAPKVTDTWAAAVSSASNPTTSQAASAAAKSFVPSLGASGAIYSCVVVSALAYPEAQIALAIPPSYPINIQTGVGAMVALDIIGILRGWRFFDHYAHLGGAAFGVAYYMYGPTFWSGLRSAVAPQRAKTSS